MNSFIIVANIAVLTLTIDAMHELTAAKCIAGARRNMGNVEMWCGGAVSFRHARSKASPTWRLPKCHVELIIQWH